jgi:hypothetical protein
MPSTLDTEVTGVNRSVTDLRPNASHKCRAVYPPLSAMMVVAARRYDDCIAGWRWVLPLSCDYSSRL